MLGPQDALTAFHGGRAMLRLGLSRLGPFAEAISSATIPALLAAYAEGICTRRGFIPASVAAVEALRTAGYATAICTNKPEGSGGGAGAAAGDCAVCSERWSGRTPCRCASPTRRPIGWRWTRVGGTRSMLVGDTETDRQTGLAAGVPVALVTFGPEGQGVSRFAPEALLDHFDQLPEVVEQFLGR